eukprot:5386171-Amphidinium_carterae.1
MLNEYVLGAEAHFQDQAPEGPNVNLPKAGNKTPLAGNPKGTAKRTFPQLNMRCIVCERLQAAWLRQLFDLCSNSNKVFS